MRALVFYKKSYKAVQRLVLMFALSCVLYFAYLTFGFDVSQQLTRPNKKIDVKYYIQNAQTSDGAVSALENSGVQNTTLTFTKYDYRARVLDLYFKKNQSPLYGFGSFFVAACDKYGAPKDCTLLPAIGQVETGLCHTASSQKQHNCWGYGGSGANRIIYPNYDQAIDEITRRLILGYGKDFFNDPEIGELAYCGAHCNTWGDKVKVYQQAIKNLAKANGYQL
jgi:hypothetical protein